MIPITRVYVLKDTTKGTLFFFQHLTKVRKSIDMCWTEKWKRYGWQTNSKLGFYPPLPPPQWWEAHCIKAKKNQVFIHLRHLLSGWREDYKVGVFPGVWPFVLKFHFFLAKPTNNQDLDMIETHWLSKGHISRASFCQLTQPSTNPTLTLILTHLTMLGDHRLSRWDIGRANNCLQGVS